MYEDIICTITFEMIVPTPLSKLIWIRFEKLYTSEVIDCVLQKSSQLSKVCPLVAAGRFRPGNMSVVSLQNNLTLMR